MSTAVDCSGGHCLHGGTAVGTWWCCKCGKYIGSTILYTVHGEDKLSEAVEGVLR